MKIIVITLAAIAGSLATAPAALALDLCSVRLSQPVTDDLGNRFSAGQTLPVTTYQTGRNGDGSFCAEGGSCLPEFVTVAGRKTRAATLTNCSIDRQHGSNGFFPLAPTPGPVPAARIAQGRVEEQLRDAGVAHAQAADAAAVAARHPRSATARSVRQALAGSHAAVARLNAAGSTDR